MGGTQVLSRKGPAATHRLNEVAGGDRRLVDEAFLEVTAGSHGPAKLSDLVAYIQKRRTTSG